MADTETTPVEVKDPEPHLITENPPLSALTELARIEFTSHIAYFISVILFLYGFWIYHSEHLGHMKSFGDAFVRDDVLYFVLGLVFMLASFSGFHHTHKERKKKWSTIYRTIPYQFINKNSTFSLEVQIEIPEHENTEDVYTQLKDCATGPLFTLFHSTDNPSREMVWDCIERAMAIKQREIDLHILRMQLIGIIEKSLQQPIPPPTAPTATPPPPRRRAGLIGSDE